MSPSSPSLSSLLAEATPLPLDVGDVPPALPSSVAMLLLLPPPAPPRLLDPLVCREDGVPALLYPKESSPISSSMALTRSLFRGECEGEEEGYPPSNPGDSHTRPCTAKPSSLSSSEGGRGGGLGRRLDDLEAELEDRGSEDPPPPRTGGEAPLDSPPVRSTPPSP